MENDKFWNHEIYISDIFHTQESPQFQTIYTWSMYIFSTVYDWVGYRSPRKSVYDWCLHHLIRRVRSAVRSAAGISPLSVGMRCEAFVVGLWNSETFWRIYSELHRIRSFSSQIIFSRVKYFNWTKHVARRLEHSAFTLKICHFNPLE